MHNVKVGDRIRLTSMPEDPYPLPVGATGTVTYVGPEIRGFENWFQVGAKWDAPHKKRSILLIVPPDRFEIIESQKNSESA